MKLILAALFLASCTRFRGELEDIMQLEEGATIEDPVVGHKRPSVVVIKKKL